MVTLEASKPFRNLTATELNALRQIARERSIPAGQDVFREGESGDGVYVVRAGKVEISVRVSEGVERVFAQLGPGDLFGEMAVIELKPRSATARAVSDTTVYFIPREELLVMVERSPVLSLELLREISQRLREFNQRYVQEILQAERLAVVGRFARSIVHDLKNPLNIIGLTSEITCLDGASPEMRQKAAGTIRKQVERINEMVSEILDFTQGVRVDYVLDSMDYAAFVKQVLEELRSETEVRGATFELPAPPPAVKVPLDPKRMRRVFSNLSHNATEAMPDGGKIIVRFKIENREVITELEDTGPGIPPQIADRLFEPFATFGKKNGTGLGLSICRKIVEDHRGRIWAKNISVGGAVFAFALPVSI